MQWVWDQAVQASGAADALRWPSDRTDIRTFAETVLSFARDARSNQDGSGYAAGFVGGRGTHNYHVLHFTRAMLLAIDARLSGAVRGYTMKQIQAWTPDQNDHLQVLLGQSTDQIEAMGVNPLMLGCWTCLMNDVSDGDLERFLRASWADLWWPVRKYMAEATESEDSFPPGPRIIASQMAEREQERKA